MITVTTKRDANHNLYEVEVSGHAMQAPMGEDIVCSGVSVLAQATLNGLIEVIKAKVEYTIEDGYIKFQVDKNQRNKDTIQTLMETFELGIESLTQGYGNYVILVKEEVQPHD